MNLSSTFVCHMVSNHCWSLRLQNVDQIHILILIFAYLVAFLHCRGGVKSTKTGRFELGLEQLRINTYLRVSDINIM